MPLIDENKISYKNGKREKENDCFATEQVLLAVDYCSKE